MKQKQSRGTYSLAQNAPYQIDYDAYKGEHRGVAVFSTPVGWVYLDQQAGDKTSRSTLGS